MMDSWLMKSLQKLNMATWRVNSILANLSPLSRKVSLTPPKAKSTLLHYSLVLILNKLNMQFTLTKFPLRTNKTSNCCPRLPNHCLYVCFSCFVQNQVEAFHHIVQWLVFKNQLWCWINMRMNFGIETTVGEENDLVIDTPRLIHFVQKSVQADKLQSCSVHLLLHTKYACFKFSFQSNWSGKM